MSGFIMWGQMLLCLIILVFFHEAGHFIAARAFGIRVEKFYLFFDAWGKKLFSFVKGDTEYGIGWLPLGGYVKISGMIDESVDTEQLKNDPEPWEFRSKPAWQRLIVMIGGVVVNVLLAFLVMTFYYMKYGESYIKMESLEQGIIPGKLGEELGLLSGDKIIAVNGNKIERYSTLISNELLVEKDPVLTVERAGKQMDIQFPSDLPDRYVDSGKEPLITYDFKYGVGGIGKGSAAEKAGLSAGDSLLAINGQSIVYFYQLRNYLIPRANQNIELTFSSNGVSKTATVKLDSLGRMGFAPIDFTPRERQTYGFAKAVPMGMSRCWDILAFQLKSFSKMFSGDINVQKSLGGPIAIAYELFGDGFRWDTFLLSTALLSMILAFMNILPIPALDGGHVMFLIWEMITGKAPSDKVLLVAQYIGMIILLSLMVFIFGNDIWRYFIK